LVLSKIAFTLGQSGFEWSLPFALVSSNFFFSFDSFNMTIPPEGFGECDYIKLLIANATRITRERQGWRGVC